jgi:hypothetical protein
LRLRLAEDSRQLLRRLPHFVGKIVLRQRIVWFKRDDGERENPKENSAWFLWGRSLLRIHRPPIILYAPARGVAAMIDMALAVIVVAAPLLALAVDLAALAGWLRMRWRSPPMGRPTSRREWFHENGSLKSRWNLLGGGFGSLPRSVCKHYERLELIRGDVEPVSDAARNAHFHDITDLAHAGAPSEGHYHPARNVAAWGASPTTSNGSQLVQLGHGYMMG